MEPPCLTRALGPLTLVRDAIARVAGEGSRWRTEIMQIIDPARIEEEQGGWEANIALLASIVDVFSSIQTPARKFETQFRWRDLHQELQDAARADQPLIFCRSIRFLLGRAHFTCLDGANARCRAVPQLC